MLVSTDMDVPTRAGHGFLLKYIAPRLEPVHLLAFLAQKPLFSFFSPRSDVIIGLGHGDENTYYGRGFNPMLQVGQYNPDEVRGKFIKLISCLSGADLGPDMIKNGALAFQGYKEEYVFLFDADYTLSPWRDPVATEFFQPVIDALNLLLDGSTNMDVYNAEVAGYNKKLEVEENPLAKGMLCQDRDALVYLGEKEAKVSPRPKISFPFMLPLPPLLGA